MAADNPSSSRSNLRKRQLFADAPAPKAKSARKSTAPPNKLAIKHPRVPGTVLACGQGDTGQLGLGESVTEKKRFQPVKIDEKCTQIVCGGMHTVCLTEEGKVFTFGCNDESALGRKTEEEEENFMPGPVDIPTKIVQISAGDSHSAALDSDGVVYVWGIFRDAQGTLGLSTSNMKHCVTPFKLENIPEMVKISSGYNHVTMLSESGQVYSVGAAEQGELGRVSKYQSIKGGRRGVSSVLEPGLVHFPGRELIEDIWSFGYNSFFVSKKKNLYSCGLNNYAQTGTFSTENNVYVPTKVKGVELDGGVKQVCGGDHHTLILTNNNGLYVVGRGDLGRLGIGSEPTDPEYIPVPKKLDLADVDSIGAGSCVSFAVSKDGKLFSWGASTNNQLGLGEEDDVLAPEHVVSKQFETQKAIQVSAGGQHSVCLVVNSD